MTTPTFQSRRDARRFLLGFSISLAGAGFGIAAIIASFTHHARDVLDWFWLTEAAVPLVLIGQLIDSGPVRRASRGAKTRFGLLRPSALRDALRVARFGPKGKAALPEDLPQLFTDRRSARSFLAGVVLIPVGFVLPLALSIALTGTSVRTATPSWVGFVGLLWVAGLVLVVLPVSRFLNRQDALPEGQRLRARRSWSLFFSGDGLREAFRVAVGR